MFDFQDLLARSLAFLIRLFLSKSSYNVSEEVGLSGGTMVEIVTAWMAAGPPYKVPKMNKMSFLVVLNPA
jgi:hypothetical protein